MHDASGRSAETRGAPAGPWGEPAERRRRPSEAGACCAPYAGRRPGRSVDRRALLTFMILTLSLSWGAALIAACGDSSGGASADAVAPATEPASCPSSAAGKPTRGGAPLMGTPEKAARAYWKLLAAGDRKVTAAACAPAGRAPLSLAELQLKRVKVLSAEAYSGGGDAATVLTELRLVPDGDMTPWNPNGEQSLFVHLAKAGGGWLVSDIGTGP